MEHKALDRSSAKPTAKSNKMQPGKEPELLQQLMNLKLLLTICSSV